MGKKQDKLNQDISLVHKLYPDFQEISPLLEAAYEGEKEFYRDHPEIIGSYTPDDSHQQIRRKFIDDISLGLGNLSIKASSFKKLLTSVARKVGQEIPEAKKTMEELESYLPSLFPAAQENTTKDQVLLYQNRAVEETSLQNDLASFLFHFTLSSIYRQSLEGLVKELDTSPWRRGDCPVCEERPHYGILRQEDGAKILECWLCGTRWQHTRVQCPGCANHHQGRLGLFTVEGEEVCRIQYCQECSGYYKVLTFASWKEKISACICYIWPLSTMSCWPIMRDSARFPGLNG